MTALEQARQRWETARDALTKISRGLPPPPTYDAVVIEAREAFQVYWDMRLGLAPRQAGNRWRIARGLA